MPLMATVKIQGEMTKSASDPYVQLVGQFLIDHVNNNPKDAEKLTSAARTILGSIDAMTTAAKAKQKNGRAMLSDTEGFAIVLKYFGVNGNSETTSAPALAKSIDIDLTDLF